MAHANVLYSVSTLAALGLDIYVRRQQTQRGVYRLHDLPDNKPRAEATRGPFTDEAGPNYPHNGHSDSRDSLAWEEPVGRPSMGPYSEGGVGGYGGGENKHVQSQGYSVPEAQFEYDTQYQGGHQERLMR